MKRCIIFDLDGTLAAPGAFCSDENRAALLKLAERGVILAISSGKPTFYLCGFARQLGLPDTVLIGENGAVIQKGVELPPPLYREAKIPSVTKEALKELRSRLEQAFPDRIWYQPNATALTPFPAYQEDFPPIKKLISDFITPEMNLTVYDHPDCFDVVYSPLSKAEGVRLLSSLTGISPDEMVAVGDWVNDYPMFEAVGYSVGIRLPEPERATVTFPTLSLALDHLLELTAE